MQTPAAESAYKEIRHMLTSGALRPGERLVNRTLASELGVSAIPVREAIQRLASEGLVEHIPGAGAFARTLGQREVAKLYEFREQLETYAAREAARNIQRFQLDQLAEIMATGGALLDELRNAPGQEATRQQVDRWLRVDASFHELVIEAADNPWLTKASTEMRLLSLVVASKPRSLELQEATLTHRQHGEIAEAIGKGNAIQASELMGHHISRSVGKVLKCLRDPIKGGD